MAVLHIKWDSRDERDKLKSECLAKIEKFGRMYSHKRV